MKSFNAFIKKEWMELLRSYKVFIITSIFIGLGCLSVFAAKYLPELMQSFMPEGLTMEIPTPTVYDAWAQFFKNITQIGLIAFVLVISTSLANEIKHKTLIMLLSKGLSRKSVILAKVCMAMVLFTIAYALAGLITQLYCMYFWSGQSVDNLLASILLVWVFTFFLVCLIQLGGVVFASSYSGLLFCGGVVALLMIASIVPSLQDYNPIQLISVNMNLLQGSMPIQDIFVPTIICFLLGILALCSACYAFDKKAL